MSNDANRFKTVVRVKRHQEKIAQQQLRQIQDEHEREREALDQLQGTREDAMNEAIHFGKARVTDVQVQRAFIYKLNRQIDHQANRVDEIRDKEVEKLDELTRRAQSRQMVEKVDERRRDEAERVLDKKEQGLIDEVANRRKNI
jgi:flagellar export protein FliJ